MRVVIQRVVKAAVSVDNVEIGKIHQGYLLFLGIVPDDTQSDIDWIIRKTTQLKLFPDEHGRMSRSLLDIKGEALVISQFTLHASTKKGTRPSFHRACPPTEAKILYEKFHSQLKSHMPSRVQTGEFGAEMTVSLINDGPVTILLDSKHPE